MFQTIESLVIILPKNQWDSEHMLAVFKAIDTLFEEGIHPTSIRIREKLETQRPIADNLLYMHNRGYLNRKFIKPGKGKKRPTRAFYVYAIGKRGRKKMQKLIIKLKFLPEYRK